MERTCPKCSKPTGEGDKFCAECGWDLSRPFSEKALGVKGSIVLVAVVLLVWGFSWSVQAHLAGKKPGKSSVASTAHAPSRPEVNDPVLKRLYAEVEAAPDDLAKLKELANALVERVSSPEHASAQSIMQAIDVLRKVLEAEPSHAESLLAMANITFASNVFDKALEYHKRYLEVRPEDHDIRSQYGSILTVVGRVDEAIKELKTVLEKEPTSFHAAANLAVAYWIKGEKQEYRSMRERALAAAPSDEERKRITRFLDGLEEKGERKGGNDLTG